MRRDQGEFERRNVQIVTISPTDGPTANSVCGMLNVPYTCLGDPSGEAYEAYGLARGELTKLINLKTLLKGTLAFFRGYRQGEAVGDRFRLPGVFFISSEGKILWLWRGRDASDHPSSHALLSALDGLRQE